MHPETAKSTELEVRKHIKGVFRNDRVVAMLKVGQELDIIVRVLAVAGEEYSIGIYNPYRRDCYPSKSIVPPKMSYIQINIGQRGWASFWNKVDQLVPLIPAQDR